jgi:hypothetical protein
MIIKIHGTSGSGKTTTVRNLFDRCVVKPTPIWDANGRRPEAYECSLPGVPTPVYVLGPYTAVCGGMDSISDDDEKIRLLNHYAKLGHVVYEGLLSSEYYGRLGFTTEKWGDNHVFAFLDTPIEVCIERVKARRLAKGNTKPLDEANTRGRVKKIIALRMKLEHKLNRRVVTLPYLSAAEIIWNMLAEAEK